MLSIMIPRATLYALISSALFVSCCPSHFSSFFLSLSVSPFVSLPPLSLLVVSFFFFPSLSAEEEVENFDVSSLQEEVLRNIEADSFWCMSKLLDGIQVNWFPVRRIPGLLKPTVCVCVCERSGRGLHCWERKQRVCFVCECVCVCLTCLQ